MTMTPYGHGLSMVPPRYMHKATKWPMRHPDTEQVVKVHGDHEIREQKAKTAAVPWWEPIQLQRKWAEVLQRPEWGWSWVAHLTFRDEIHPEAAEKCFNRCIHILNREVFGNHWWRRPDRDGVLWARGAEKQQRGVLHYHALLSRVPATVDQFKYKELWNDLAGFARIYPFEANKGGESYVVKYAAKGGNIDVGGPLGLMANRLPAL